MSWFTPRFLVGGGVGLVGRRALTPVLVVGTAFGSAAWFGVFEIATGVLEFGMPVPANPDVAGHYMGVATVPPALGVSGFVRLACQKQDRRISPIIGLTHPPACRWQIGWRTCPTLPTAPTDITNVHGWLKYGGSLPLRHVGVACASSAVVAAVSCRVVQYRNGA